MNTCRFGHLEDPALACLCAPRCGLNHQATISAPLFDRIGLLLDVPPVHAADLSLPPPAEGSAEIAARVTAAYGRKRLRFTDQEIGVNAKADGAFLEEIAALNNEERTLFNQAANRMKLSARGYHRILGVARTLADIDGQHNVRRLHIAEALSYHQIAPSR